MTDEAKTILVVDDEPDTIEFLTAVLQDHGYKTITARDGAEALRQVEQHAPDLVTLDVTMPESTGVAAYRALRTDDRFKGIPVVIVTGISKDFEKFISTRKKVPPPDGYLAKPVEPGQLVEIVDRILG